MLSFLKRVFVLYNKEWMRLKRNPAALMAVGLIVLMAFLVSLENTASKKEKRSDKLPCAIVYGEESGLIAYLKQDKQARKINFIETDITNLKQNKTHYERNIRCVAEVIETPDEKTIRLRFKAVKPKSQQMSNFSRWLLSRSSTYSSGIHIKQSLKAIKNKSPKTLGSIDLGSNKSKAMIGAMMIFSAQYFLCCALFISFTGHEKERGILQGIALTTTSPVEILLSKILFHISLSIMASFLIMWILNPPAFFTTRNFLLVYPYLLLLLISSSVGFVSIASIITSLNRNQSTASLIGFCYLMVMGVIFSLSSKLKAFAVIKNNMFESHAIELFNFWLNPAYKYSRKELAVALAHYIDLLFLSTILLVFAFILFKRKGWRSA